jgi:hypothetical protein
MNNPKPPPEKHVSDEDSVVAAERQFFNHTGPLVDIDGPGSKILDLFHLLGVLLLPVYRAHPPFQE